MADLIIENTLTAETTFGATDLVRIITAAGGSRKITGANFVTALASLGVGSSIYDYKYTYKDATFPASNPMLPATIAGTEFNTKVLAADDTTPQSILIKDKLPGTLASGNVTFFAVVSAQTAATSDVAISFGHAARATGQTWDDGAYTYENTTATMTAVSNDSLLITWTETVANLGWAANDTVYQKWSRGDGTGTMPAGDTLTDDLYFHAFGFTLP